MRRKNSWHSDPKNGTPEAQFRKLGEISDLNTLNALVFIMNQLLRFLTFVHLPFTFNFIKVSQPFFTSHLFLKGMVILNMFLRGNLSREEPFKQMFIRSYIVE